MAGMASDAQLFEDDFRITKLSDPKYDRVDRIYTLSVDGQTKMELDINKELFPCSIGDTLHIVIATSLALDGSKDDEKGWRDASKLGGGEATLADMFEYVCYGKIYKFDDAENGQNMWVSNGLALSATSCRAANIRAVARHIHPLGAF